MKTIQHVHSAAIFGLTIVALAGWIFIFVTSGWHYMLSAAGLVAVGVIAFRVFSARAAGINEKQ